jgi:hypothetical protein
MQRPTRTMQQQQTHPLLPPPPAPLLSVLPSLLPQPSQAATLTAGAAAAQMDQLCQCAACQCLSRSAR